MKKLSESVREAKEALKALEAEQKSAAEKLNNCHRSKEEAKNELATARSRLEAAKQNVEKIIFDIAEKAAQPEDLKTARAAVRGIIGEIEDLEVVVSTYDSLEFSLKTELSDAQARLSFTGRAVWVAVCDELRAEFQRLGGDLFWRLLAANELSGQSILLSSGDPLLMLILGNHGAMPKLDEVKEKLREKYLQ